MVRSGLLPAQRAQLVGEDHRASRGYFIQDVAQVKVQGSSLGVPCQKFAEVN